MGGSSGAAGKAGGGMGGSDTGTPSVRFIGRMDTKDAAGPRFAWSGSGIIARFEGTSVGVKLTGSQQYTVVLDGMVRPKLVSTSGTTAIAQGLSAGTHVVELYRRTEANLGEAQFQGFDFGAGKLLSPPAAKARRIEIIGDSISCGYGNEGANMSCPFSADTENHYLSYGALAARSVDAELVTVAWSGKGVFCNYGDDANSCVDPMPTYYERTLPARADSKWDFASWQPDAVIINLGTNDLSTEKDPSQTQFETAYKSLIQTVRSKYANAYILCTNGSMLSGADLTQARTYIAGAVKAVNDAGDSKVKAFELNPQQDADGFGCDYHPSLATHQKMATQVTAVLRSTLGW
jgi:lysophospholipase L1-like esterase